MKMLPIQVSRLFCAGMLFLLLTGCSTGTVKSLASVQDETSNFELSHSKDAEPDYDTVFPQDTVNRIDIKVSEAAWSDLQSEMTGQFGAFGDGSTGGQPMGGQPPVGNRPTQPAGQIGGESPTGVPEGFQPSEGFILPEGTPAAMPEGFQPPDGMPGGGNRPGGAAMGGIDFGETTYVKSTITFNGETWEDVGFRYSGNSTLQTSWRTGTLKISFRLDFDEFEDENPSIKDQRFYGFKQLSFKSNAMDDSYIREKVVSDIFRDAGVVSSRTAFYEVFVDYGNGPQYFGVYTVVEIVDDTLIKTQFAEDDGNVYKPEGTGAAFVEGTFNEASFEEQTNAGEADWSDIQAVFKALHSDLRSSDPAAWREKLESVFDVDAFIRWLAVDTIIQNWDAYGSMAHNYYLYNDPADGLLTWIPWDNNMALSGNGGMGREGGNTRRGGARELDVTRVGDQWPLISYLADDPVYLATYKHYLEEAINNAWQPEELTTFYTKYHNLIDPYVEKESKGYTQLSSYAVFEQSLEELISHAQERYDAVVEYLAE